MRYFIFFLYSENVEYGDAGFSVECRTVAEAWHSVHEELRCYPLNERWYVRDWHEEYPQEINSIRVYPCPKAKQWIMTLYRDSGGDVVRTIGVDSMRAVYNFIAAFYPTCEVVWLLDARDMVSFVSGDKHTMLAIDCWSFHHGSL